MLEKPRHPGATSNQSQPVQDMTAPLRVEATLPEASQFFRDRHSTLRTTLNQFLSCDDPHQAFILLDNLCEQLIAMEQSVLPSDILAIRERVLPKVGRIDSFCERKSAQEILSLGRTDLQHYPWSLRDFYEAEKAFILENLPRNIDAISVFGHGAIPHSALLLSEYALELIDSDAQVSALAKRIFKQFAPQCTPVVCVGDIQDYRSNATQALNDTRTSFDSVGGLAIVANAALPALLKRERPLPHGAVFIRSSTEKGSLLYPRVELSELTTLGYEVVAWKRDPLYGIHEWILCTPIQTLHRDFFNDSKL